MLSDDDKPLTSNNGPNGQERHVVANGNGHINGGSEDYPMSEDDDMPLVRMS